jgi:signal recognition particle subunit SEC65
MGRRRLGKTILKQKPKVKNIAKNAKEANLKCYPGVAVSLQRKNKKGVTYSCLSSRLAIKRKKNTKGFILK